MIAGMLEEDYAVERFLQALNGGLEEKTLTDGGIFH